MDELLVRHRKEQRDLQSRVTQKKKSATKKTRKGINEECENLERELKERQAAEIVASTVDTPANGLTYAEGHSSIGSADEPNGERVGHEAEKPVAQPLSAASRASSTALDLPQSDQALNKPNRQRARLARRAAEREAVAAEAAQESLSLPDLKKREKAVMDSEIARRGLQEQEVQADGHCLYAAVADGLKHQNLDLLPSIQPVIVDENAPTKQEDYKIVRRTAAEYIEAHQDDFMPFLEEPLHTYVHKVGQTAEWGGQLELLALAKAYGVDIAVLQGDGRIVEIEGGSGDNKKLWLAYYKHYFRLGEHYNSLRKVK